MGEYISPDKINIKHKLGQGGFGEVYLGILNGHDQVAVKICLDDSSNFKSECRLLAKLRHRCVLQYYGHSRINKKPVMITEYMQNGSLGNALKYSPHVVEWEAKGKEILRDVALGLAFLHGREHPVIHSDLKPDNILLDGNWNAKIGDVGISKEKKIPDCEVGVSGVINTSLYGGTDFYMAPECFKGRINTKSDVFSFGIILWQVYTGRSDTHAYGSLGKLVRLNAKDYAL